MSLYRQRLYGESLARSKKPQLRTYPRHKLGLRVRSGAFSRAVSFETRASGFRTYSWTAFQATRQ